MKNVICIALVLLTAIPFSVADEKSYPLDFKMQVYPEKIRYGDACFLSLSVTNKGTETLLLPCGGFEDCAINGQLLYREKTLLNFRDLNVLDGTERSGLILYEFPGHPVKPGKTIEFLFCMVWIPLPEFSKRDNAIELHTLLERNQKNFLLRFDVYYHWAYAQTFHPRFDAKGLSLKENEIVREGLTAKELEKKRPEYQYEATYRASPEQIECPIIILARPTEEFELLQEWYLELPTTVSQDEWTMDHVFAHPFHVRGSPYKMEAPTPFELRNKRIPFYDDYRKFFSSMETRTPETLARIKRTNELAAQILERAKEPNSTISQNMVEFIQLRGFLVDIRYAENPAAEKAAWEKLMDFVENARDKELWLKFLMTTGFHSIHNYDHFPFEKLNPYGELFIERFSEDIKKIEKEMRP